MNSQSRTGSVSLAIAKVLGWLSFLAAGILGLSVSLATEGSFEIIADKDAPGHDFKRMNHVSLEDCERRCLEETQCAAFTYNHRRRVCFLKNQAAPHLVDYRGATTGLRQGLREADQSQGQPKSDSASPVAKEDVTARQAPPDQPVILVEPDESTSPTTKVCSLFDSKFALIRNLDITLKFDQVEANSVGDDKARMILYDKDAKILAGNLRVQGDGFKFVEDTNTSAGHTVVILDSVNPAGNSISDPVFVVVGGLPTHGGVFRRVTCETP